MKNVSLTYFLDFVLRAGTPKLTVVRDFKSRGEYDPQTDFYKPFRDKLIETLRGGKPISTLEGWATTAHERKQSAYLAITAGLRKFLGRRPPIWFEPPRGTYGIGPLTLNVNPELGLVLHGVPHVIKIYWKDEPRLTKARVRVVLHVMRQALADPAVPRVFGILDARNGRLHAFDPSSRGLGALLHGEAASFAGMHAQL